VRLLEAVAAPSWHPFDRFVISKRTGTVRPQRWTPLWRGASAHYRTYENGGPKLFI